MTISGTTLRNDYVSVGQVGPFAYTFRILNSTHLGVYLDGVLQGSGYTVTNVGDVAGGVVNFASATNAGAKVTLLLNVPFTQPTDYVENDPDPAQVKEDALDLACQRDRQLAEVDQRTMKFPTTSTTVNKFLPEPETGKLLRWKSTGDLESVADTTLSTGGATLPLSIANGGTGGTTVPTARENLSTQTTIVAAATLPVTGEQMHIVTGNTGITALASKAAGTRVVLRFTGTPLITHNATSLILIGAVSYQVVAGDVLELISEGSGNWRELRRQDPAVTLSGSVVLTRVSGTQIKLGARNGGYLPVRVAGIWRLRSVGTGLLSSNPTTATNFVNGTGSTALSANTVYLVTVFDNAGTLTFDFLTTLTHTVDTDSGVEIKSGDPTRTVVGMIRTNATPNFVDSVTQRFVLSWFTRRALGLVNAFTANRTTVSASYVELNTEIRCEFLTWLDEAVFAAASGAVDTGGASSQARTSLGFDGATAEETCNFASNTNDNSPIGLSLVKSGLTEGYHFATLLGRVAAGTGSWQGSATPGLRTSVTVSIRG